MLSVQQCRKILGQHCDLSDSAIESFRNQLYGLADITIDLFLTKKRTGNELSLMQTGLHHIEELTNTDLEKREERSAIMEYDGKIPRTVAERIAAKNLRKEAAS